MSFYKDKAVPEWVSGTNVITHDKYLSEADRDWSPDSGHSNSQDLANFEVIWNMDNRIQLDGSLVDLLNLRRVSHPKELLKLSDINDLDVMDRVPWYIECINGQCEGIPDTTCTYNRDCNKYYEGDE